MAELDLDAIEARANAATPGPWNAWDRGVGFHIALGDERDDWGRPEDLLPEGLRTDIGRRADAEFIAAARTDVPALVAEVRRLRAELDELRRHLGAVDVLTNLGWSAEADRLAAALNQENHQ